MIFFFGELISASLQLAICAPFMAAAEKESAPPATELSRAILSVEEIKNVSAFVGRLATESGGPLLRLIASGEFIMGDNSRNGTPSHRVTLTLPFFLGATELTQAQWTVVMGTNPSHFQGPNLPLENVSWEDAMAFCQKLTERERSAGRLPAGWAFTLPTEAQWEYACRAGTTGDYAGDLDAMSWNRKDSGRETHAVGMKLPNAQGLFDMHGNVWEWCRDCYASYPKGGEAVTDPTGPPPTNAASDLGNSRAIRGGSFATTAEPCRSGYRAARHQRFTQFSGDPTNTGYFGFRLALIPVR